MSEPVIDYSEPTWTVYATEDYWDLPPCPSCGKNSWFVHPEGEFVGGGKILADVKCSVCDNTELVLFVTQG